MYNRRFRIELVWCDDSFCLSVLSAGAYGFVMASNYNSRPRAAEVMVRGDKFEIIKEREKFADLIKGESIPDFL